MYTAGSTRFATNKVEDYILKKNVILPKTSERYLQFAYTAFSHCIAGKWRYIMRTIQDIWRVYSSHQKMSLVKFLFKPYNCQKLVFFGRNGTGLLSPYRYPMLVLTLSTAVNNASRRISQLTKGQQQLYRCTTCTTFN